jgi:CRISPR-associated endoribonuclease Cas6
MRLKLICRSEKGFFIPYNHLYQLQSAIYSLIRKSSIDYSHFLHDEGFSKAGKPLKLFTFSKLLCSDYIKSRGGFSDVRDITLYFATRIEKSYEHLILGIFTDQKMMLNFNKKNILEITSIETLSEPEFSETMKFSCLSPITVSIMDDRGKHYLDYLIPEERIIFQESLKKNLLRKYKELFNEDYLENPVFEFSFDPEYIANRKGNISKLISFKDNLKIKAMEAPFKIKTDPVLIEIAYDCGLGELNSAGFGMIRVI